MGLSALSIFTHGWHHPGLVEVEVSDAPVLQAVVEVRPEVRATYATEVQGPVDPPVITAATELKPEILSTQGPEQATSEDTPTVVSSEEVRPIIRGARED